MERPSFYAIIPAKVRYSDLKPSAKLLYGEITALSNQKGYCYASNRYFAELYGVTKNTISLWVKNLYDYGFIDVRVERDKNKQVVKRMITIIKNNDTTTIKKSEVTNTTNNNTYNNNINIRQQKFEELVFQVTDVSKDLLKEFCDYWTESNKSNTKMRFEMERTFDLNKRLKRWVSNNQKWNFGQKKSVESKTKQSVKTWENARNLLKNLNS